MKLTRREVQMEDVKDIDDSSLYPGRMVTLEFTAQPFMSEEVDKVTNYMKRAHQRQAVKNAIILLIKAAIVGALLATAVTIIVAWSWLEL